MFEKNLSNVNDHQQRDLGVLVRLGEEKINYIIRSGWTNACKLASVYFTLKFYLDLILVPLTFSFDFYSHGSFFTCPFELHNKWCFNLFLIEVWSIQDLFYLKTPVLYSVHVIGWKLGIWIYFVKERTSQLRFTEICEESDIFNILE